MLSREIFVSETKRLYENILNESVVGQDNNKIYNRGLNYFSNPLK